MQSPPDDIRYMPGTSKLFFPLKKKKKVSLSVLIGQIGVTGDWETKLPVHIWKPGR